MSDLLVKAACDEVGLRRESSIDSSGLPLWLARLHLALPAGAALRLSVEGDIPVPLGTLIEGAGFSGVGPDYVRLLSLPDFVVPGMRFLICGLNPSVHAAEAGVGFVSPSNRFWSAANEAGLVSRDRRPIDAATMDGVGFTDLVKRATPKANEINRAEFRAGFARLDRLAAWLLPKTIVMVGLSGWRAATDKDATAGWQTTEVGGCPVYVMPSTSGLNTHQSHDDLVAHMLEATGGPPPGSTASA